MPAIRHAAAVVAAATSLALAHRSWQAWLAGAIHEAGAVTTGQAIGGLDAELRLACVGIDVPLVEMDEGLDFAAEVSEQ